MDLLDNVLKLKNKQSSIRKNQLSQIHAKRSLENQLYIEKEIIFLETKMSDLLKSIEWTQEKLKCLTFTNSPISQTRISLDCIDFIRYIRIDHLYLIAEVDGEFAYADLSNSPTALDNYEALKAIA